VGGIFSDENTDMQSIKTPTNQHNYQHLIKFRKVTRQPVRGISQGRKQAADNSKNNNLYDGLGYSTDM
jgi:ribosomal protein L19E